MTLQTEQASARTADERFMHLAMEQALEARNHGEVPVGAVITDGEIVLATGRNRNLETNDPTAHAEVVALRRAGGLKANHRLPGCTVYVTLEPCSMCVGAMVHARVGRVVYGAPDPKTGALGGAFDLLAAGRHNHQFQVRGGVLGEECSEQLRAFFRERRGAGASA